MCNPIELHEPNNGNRECARVQVGLDIARYVPGSGVRPALAKRADRPFGCITRHTRRVQLSWGDRRWRWGRWCALANSAKTAKPGKPETGGIQNEDFFDFSLLIEN